MKEKNKIMKYLNVGVLLLLVNFVMIQNMYASEIITVGTSSNGKYQTNGHCFLEDRDSASVFVTVFSSTLTKKFDGTGEIPAKSLFNYMDNLGWEQDLNADATVTNINNVDLMLFVGHGLKKGTEYTTLSGNTFIRGTNALHYYTNNGGSFAQSTLGGETLGSSNCTTVQAKKWGKNGSKTKWVSIFSCNFLNTDDQYAKKENIMNGLHALMGFSTKMYIDSRQGTYYATCLREGGNIIDSFFDSCYMCQRKKISGGVTAVVYYASKSRNDTIYEYSSKPALNNSSQYREIRKSYVSK